MKSEPLTTSPKGLLGLISLVNKTYAHLYTAGVHFRRLQVQGLTTTKDELQLCELADNLISVDCLASIMGQLTSTARKHSDSLLTKTSEEATNLKTLLHEARKSILHLKRPGSMNTD